MAIICTGANCGADTAGGTFTPPAGTTFLVGVVSSQNPAGTISWNANALTAAGAYSGVRIAYMANPAIGNYAFAHDGGYSGTRCSWLALWLRGVNIGAPVVTTGNTANPGGATFNVTGYRPGDYVVYGGYAYPDTDGFSAGGVGFNYRSAHYSGYQESGATGDAPLPLASPYAIAISGADGDDYHLWVVFAAAGGLAQVIWL